MSLTIISKRKIYSDHHEHRCPFCKRVRTESNEICQKHAPHVYPCMNCFIHYRRAYGMDFLLDAYISKEEAYRLNAVAPDEKAVELDQRDRERAEKQMAVLRQAQDERRIIAGPGTGDGRPETGRSSVVSPQSEREEKEKHERLMDEADVLTYDEVKAEIEKIEKEEKL